jgi:putative endonuclease
MYYVYVLYEVNTEKCYIGYSSDLKTRVSSHKSCSGCKTTRNGNWHLVYYEAYMSESDARKREKRLKSGNARRHLMNRIQKSLMCKSSDGEADD